MELKSNGPEASGGSLQWSPTQITNSESGSSKRQTYPKRGREIANRWGKWEGLAAHRPSSATSKHRDV
jgi:hypothetical protein